MLYRPVRRARLQLKREKFAAIATLRLFESSVQKKCAILELFRL